MAVEDGMRTWINGIADTACIATNGSTIVTTFLNLRPIVLSFFASTAVLLSYFDRANMLLPCAYKGEDIDSNGYRTTFF